MQSISRARRGLFTLAGAALAAVTFAGTATAQALLTRPIEFVVHTSAGGGTDVFARAVGDLLSRDKGINQAVTISNRKGGSEATTAVLGGHVPFTPENLSEMISMVESKKMRVLAVTSEKRLPGVPEVPTLKELGYNISVGTGRGFAMPAGVPRESAVAMEAAMKRVHDSKAWKDFAARNHYEDYYMGSAEMARYLEKRRGEMADFLTSITATTK